jgi:hypothetical protein
VATADAPSRRTKVRRHPERARYERQEVDAMVAGEPVADVLAPARVPEYVKQRLRG